MEKEKNCVVLDEASGDLISTMISFLTPSIGRYHKACVKEKGHEEAAKRLIGTAKDG